MVWWKRTCVALQLISRHHVYIVTYLYKQFRVNDKNIHGKNEKTLIISTNSVWNEGGYNIEVG